MTTAIQFDPLDHEVQQDPYRHYAQLREEAPVYFIESVGAWGLFRFEDRAGLVDLLQVVDDRVAVLVHDILERRPH